MKTKSEIFKAAHRQAKNWKMQKMNQNSDYMILFVEALKIIYRTNNEKSGFEIKSERIVKETEKAILYSAKLDLVSNNNTIVEAWIPRSAIQNNIVADWYFERNNSKLKNY